MYTNNIALNIIEGSTMLSYTIGELKANFSEVIGKVKEGEKVKVLYGKAKEPVAMIVPFEKPSEYRQLGILKGKATIEMSEDFKITPEELFGL
ncbi:MAG: hypothetical protein LBC58_01650 [Clostridiales Family XIII bacterium]|nr:hypothetical protein [Clostridiales Family XIII bacterium]